MRIAVLTISDSVARGQRQDATGPAVVARCQELGWLVTSTQLVADDALEIQTILRRLADEEHMDLILTTGGTGLGPRDVTPEATQAIADKLVPGFAEQMRRKGLEKTPRAILSRSSAAIRGRTLILNFPGSPNAVRQLFGVIEPVLGHAVATLRRERGQRVEH